MAEKIQQVPAGLLDTLGIKSLGRNPSQLGDQVVAGVDLTEFYLANRIEMTRVQNTGATAAGDEAVITIGNQEIWMVKELSMTVKNPTAIGDILNGRLGWEVNAAAASGQLVLGTTPRHVATTTALEEGTAVGVTFPEPRFFLSDTQFSAQLQEAVGGANTVRIEIRASFYRLLV